MTHAHHHSRLEINEAFDALVTDLYRVTVNGGDVAVEVNPDAAFSDTEQPDWREDFAADLMEESV